jgi:cystinosin
MWLDSAVEVTGWVYFVAWSASFYGQLVLNYRLKNVEGMNLDFLILNFTGFSFLSIYSTFGYFAGGN